MFSSDDAKRLFLREVGLTDDLQRRDVDQSLGLASLLAATTTIQSYPTTASCYFACQPLTLLGAEVEGGAGDASPGNGTFFALNLGTAVPPAGTQVVTTFVGDRWVFRYDS